MNTSPPTSRSRGTPVILILATITQVICGRGLSVDVGSCDLSIRLRAYWDACFCAVTSRAAANTPSTLPPTSLYTDALYSTSVSLPSRCRIDNDTSDLNPLANTCWHPSLASSGSHKSLEKTLPTSHPPRTPVTLIVA